LLSTPHITAPAHHRGWTTVVGGQIFIGKVFERETSQPVEECDFYLPKLHLAPLLG